MTVIKTIKSVEDKWLKKAVVEIERLFTPIWLPSHDHLHHLRVWNYAKEIIMAHQKKGVHFEYEYIEALFIACLFHDSGLSVTLSETHGKESALLSMSFLQHEGFKNNFEEEMLEAIALHDDKTYSKKLNKTEVPCLYEVLTVADDLDAFGAMGLFRYLEIYHGRNIPVTELQERITRNLKSRFKFVKENLRFDDSLLQKHDERFCRSLYYLKLLGVNELDLIVELLDEKLIVNHTVIFQSFSHSTKLHDFLSEVIVENSQSV